MNVRQAQPDDAEAIHALMLAAFTPFRDQYTPDCFDATVLDPVRIRRRMTEGPVWVAEDRHILGTVGAVEQKRGLYVRGMAVHPEARRRGIGRALLDTVEDHARRAGAPALWLSTTRFLKDSQALYLKVGFASTRGPPDLLGTPLVSFEKRL